MELFGVAGKGEEFGSEVVWAEGCAQHFCSTQSVDCLVAIGDNAEKLRPGYDDL